MAKCKVIKSYPGWNIGDNIEAYGDRLKELVDQEIVSIVEPDVVSENKRTPEELKAFRLENMKKAREARKKYKGVT